MNSRDLEVLRVTSALAAARQAVLARAWDYVVLHAADFDVDQLLELLADEERRCSAPHVLVRELAARIVSLPTRVLDAGAKASAIDPDVWFELVTLTRERLESLYWYRLVDCLRGGPVFNALNPEPFAPRPGRTIITSTERERPEPVAVRLIDADARNDDGRARKIARTLHPSRLLIAHHRAPDVITEDDLREASASQPSEDWEPPLGLMLDSILVGTIPCHIAPRDVGERPKESDYVWEEWRRDPTSSWLLDLGALLRTKNYWKKYGREVVDRYLDMGRGFPIALVEASVRGAGDQRVAVAKVVHDVIAESFVRQAEVAVTASRTGEAIRWLTALTCLNPSARIAVHLHRLSRHPECTSEVEERIALNERLFKRSRSREDAGLDGLLDAFLVLQERAS